MKKLLLVFIIFISLVSCQKDENNYSPLHDKVDGFYKIVSATSTSGMDLNGDNQFSNNIFLEIPLLNTSTLDIVVNKVGNSFHLLWLEQDTQASKLQEYNTQGNIYKFNFDTQDNKFSPIVYNNQKNSDALAAPIEMVLLREGTISCKIVREVNTVQGKSEITINAVYQKDPSIVRPFN